MTTAYAAIIALTVVVVLLAMLVVGLIRSHADIIRKLDRLGAGADSDHDHSRLTLTRRTGDSAIDHRHVQGNTPQGEPVVVALSAGTDPTLIAFLSTTCSSCTPFWEGLQSSTMFFGGHRHRVIAVTLGESEESPSRAAALAAPGLDVVMSSSAWEGFGVPGAPYFVVVDPATGSTLGEGTAMTFDALEEFLSVAGGDQQSEVDPLVPASENQYRIDDDLRRAGILPGDDRLYHDRGEIERGGEQ